MPAPPQSFYIMENKVWNELFDAYLKDKPEAARKLKDFDRRRAASGASKSDPGRSSISPHARLKSSPTGWCPAARSS